MQVKAKYFLKNVPLLNAVYLGNQKKARDKRVSNFTGNFKSNYDDDLPEGLSEEQDMLIKFIAERYHSEDYVPMVEPTLHNQQCENQLTSHKDEAEDLDDPELTDILAKRRCHCWVLVGAGKREITEQFFIEPTTGLTYGLTETPYYGVDMVWNHTNLWINMQYNEQWKRFTPVNDMSWDFRDTSKWDATLNDVNYDENDVENFRTLLVDAQDAKGMDTNSTPVVTQNSSGVTTNKQKVVPSKDLNKSTNEASPMEPSKPITPATPPISSNPSTPALNSLPGSASGKPTVTSGKPVPGPSPINMDKTKGFFEPDTTIDPKVMRDTRLSMERLKADMELSHWLLPASWVPKLQIEVEAVVTR